MGYFKQFGGKITEVDTSLFKKSAQWNGEIFENLEVTTMEMGLRKVPEVLMKLIFQQKGKKPTNKLPILPFDKDAFLAPSDTMKACWFGHSVLLLRLNNKTLLIDPMFGQDAAPIAPFRLKRFSKDTLEIIDQLPKIDLALLSHDHYDHLDLKSIERLAPKVEQYFVALGVGRHLEKWGVNRAKIQEFDWWNASQFEGITITFTPTRHFSGRGTKDRSKSLWGGWVFQISNETIYFSGDGGYGEHFKAIGEAFGGFDFAFMECGQYNEYWRPIHMFPDESIQAAVDANVKIAMPVHWGGFSLAMHPWTEPVERFIQEGEKKGMALAFPQLGEIFFSRPTPPSIHWWRNFM
jgi:L-ascorbate metabolism protein UlaG (beta-lactamase superfamily)